MQMRDWLEWHQPYDERGSPLQRRLAIVQQRIRDCLDHLAVGPGPINVVSVCAGQGRDLLGVLPAHPRRHDVVARLVELDARNVEHARNLVRTGRLTGIEVVEGDASTTNAYDGAVPADLVLVCGVFGNISPDDIAHTIEQLPRLCAPGAFVIWTRHRRAPDLTPTVRRWFSERGFGEVAFDVADDALFGIGTHRLEAAPLPFAPGIQLFTFVGDGTLGWR